MATETKIGLALILLLLSAFGFVVYKKLDKRRELLAGVQEAKHSHPSSKDDGALKPVRQTPNAKSRETETDRSSFAQQDPRPQIDYGPQEFAPPDQGRPEPAPEQFPQEHATFEPTQVQSESVDTRVAAGDFPNDAADADPWAAADPNASGAAQAEPVPTGNEFESNPFGDDPSPGGAVVQNDPGFEQTQPSGEFFEPSQTGGDEFFPAETAATTEQPPQGLFDPPTESAEADFAGNSTPVESGSAAAIDNGLPAEPGRVAIEEVRHAQAVAPPGDFQNIAPSPADLEPATAARDEFSPFPNPQPSPAGAEAGRAQAEWGAQSDAGFDSQPPANHREVYSPVDSAPAAGEGPSVHVVEKGQNYWSISRCHYGTPRYYMALAHYNQRRIPDPRKMRPGMKVLIPDTSVLRSRYPSMCPKRSGASVAQAGGGDSHPGFYRDEAGGPTYRVGAEDTLGSIARRHLGRASRWEQIYQLNRDRIGSPNKLKIGTELRLPANASQVRFAGSEAQ